jgi:hypothetical protein
VPTPLEHAEPIRSTHKEKVTMRSDKTQARVVGVLYLIASVAIVASGPFVGSTDSLEFLTEAAADEDQVMLGTLFQLAWVIAVLFIPVVLYPVLRRYSETGALGFFSLRFTEALFSLAYVIIQLTMLNLSQSFVEGAGDRSAFEASATALLEARDWAFAMGAGLAFNLSALLLNYLLYRSQLVPRWLSVWGFLGAALWMIVWFPQIYDIELGVLEAAFLPIAVQEMVFAVYLIVRGFDSTAVDVPAPGT